MIDKFDYIKTKTFYSSKNNIGRAGEKTNHKPAEDICNTHN
jgi:hypothetical protein